MRLYLVLMLVISCQILATHGFLSTNPKVKALPKASLRYPSTLESNPKHRYASLTASTSATSGLRRLALLSKIQSVLDPSVFGGLLSGGLHAITGPDHLAAILPSSVGKSAWYGARIGAIWGLGHGLSATFLGFCAFFLKGKISGKFAAVKKLTNIAESAVGFSLLAIGLLGMKESMEMEVEQHSTSEEGSESMEKKKGGGRTLLSIFANGMLHGFSWDGAPSIAPAVAMTSYRSAASFLASYSLGTMLTMSIAASSISFLSSKLVGNSDIPNLPKKLSFFSSLLAMLIGVYWIAQAFFLR